MEIKKKVAIPIAAVSLLLVGSCSVIGGTVIHNNDIKATCETSVSKAEKLNAEFPKKLEEAKDLSTRDQAARMEFEMDPDYPHDRRNEGYNNQIAIEAYDTDFKKIPTNCESKEDATKIDAQVAKVEKDLKGLDKETSELKEKYESFMIVISTNRFDRAQKPLKENVDIAKKFLESGSSGTDTEAFKALQDALKSAEPLANQSIDREEFEDRLVAAERMTEANTELEDALRRAQVAAGVSPETASSIKPQEPKKPEEQKSENKPEKKASVEDLLDVKEVNEKNCKALDTLTEAEGYQLMSKNKHINVKFVEDCYDILYPDDPLGKNTRSDDPNEGDTQSSAPQSSAPSAPEHPAPDQPNEADLRGGE